MATRHRWQETPLFNNFRTDTEECGNLAVGDIVDALESGSTEHSIWLKCDRGWFPRDTLFVVKLSSQSGRLGSDSPTAGRSTTVTPASSSSSSTVPASAPALRLSAKQAKRTDSVRDLNALHSERSAGTGPSEQVFEVTQSHVKKLRTNMQLKVGGMGLNLFDGERVIQSWLYTDLVSWQFSKLREELYISERGGVTIRLGTVDGDQIGSLMRDYALQISEAKSDEKSQSEAFAKANLLGDYTVLESLRARDEIDPRSAKRCQLDKGEVITATDCSVGDGLTRLKCAAGWVSLKPHTLEKVVDKEASAWKPGKGHSVAVHGVQTVANDMNDVATQMGLTGEKVYKVTQTHLRKAPKTIDMKVGGMGVTFFDPRGSVMLESYLYTNIAEWQYCRVQNHFILTVKTGKGASEKR